MSEEEEGNDLETGRIRTTLSYEGEGGGTRFKGEAVECSAGHAELERTVAH